jgi:tetratricopeptide (TPR) repeat protein
MLRLALLVHAASAPSSREDARTLGARLAAADAGFSVIDLPAHDDVALGLPRALEGVGAGSQILVYVGAEVVRGPSGSVELVSAARNVRFEELRATIAAVSPAAAALIVDGVHEPPPDDPFASAEVAAAVLRAMRPEASGIETLVALRNPSSPEGVVPLLLHAAAELATTRDDRIVTLKTAFEALREDERAHERVSTLSLGEALADLVLLRLPPARQTFASLPDADETFVEASRLLEQAQLDLALDALKRVLLLSEGDHVRRAEVFVRVAAIKQRQSKGREAIFNLEKALSIDPQHRTALEGLVLVAVEEKRWSDVATLGDRMIAAIGSTEERQRALVDLGTLFSDSAGDDARATALLEQARGLGPLDGDVLERLAGLHDRARRWPALCEVLEAWAGSTTHGFYRAARLAAAAKIAAAALADRPRARRLYQEALALRDDDAEVHRALGALAEADGDDDAALAAFRAAAHAAPREAATYQAIVRVATRAGRTDVGYAAATVLEHLGEADLDEQLLADQFRPDGPLRPSRPLALASWESTIAPPGGRATMAVMEAIDEAAVAARLDMLRERGELPVIDPATRTDPKTSTLSAARALAFAARLFDVPVPDLLLLPEVRGGIAAVAVETPTTAIGKAVLSGRSLPELAFLMARHLAYHRPGARVALYYPDVRELGALLGVAISIVRPELALSTRDVELVTRLRAALAPRLSEAARATLSEAVRDFEEAELRHDAVAWLRRLDVTATRAGLLAAGDLGVAAKLVEHDPAPVSDLLAEAKIEDLCAFVVSAEHEALRREIGVAVG